MPGFVSVSLDLSPPLTNLPNPRRKKKNGGGQLREHVTGCARSEGYYAISRKEKDVYLDLDLPEQVIREVENVDTSVRADGFTFNWFFLLFWESCWKNKLRGKYEKRWPPPEFCWQPHPDGFLSSRFDTSVESSWRELTPKVTPHLADLYVST